MVGAYQQFIKDSSGGTGTVNAALNGMSLRDPLTVVLGGNPLDENTFIEGDGFDLLLGTVSALNNYGVGFTGQIEFDSIAFGGEINETLTPTQYLLKGQDANNDTTIQLDKNNILINSNDIALNQQSFKGINSNVFLERVTSATSFGETRLNANGYTAEIHDTVTGEDAEISLSPTEINSQVTNIAAAQSFDSTDNSIESYYQILDSGDVTFRKVNTGREETNFDLVSLGFNYSDIFDGINDTYNLNFKDSKRGIHFNSNVDWIIEFFENTDTKSSKVELNGNSSLIRYGDLGTSIFNKVEADLLTAVVESDHNTIKSLITLTGGAAGFGEIETHSNLGLRENADYSANYIGLSLTNQIYTDGNVNGMNVTNSPTLANDVLVFNGVNLTWQPQSGSGGGGLMSDASYSIGSIDSGSASANQVQYVKYNCKSDIDITRLSSMITSFGLDTMTVGVFDLANNLLVQGVLTGVGTGVKSTVAFPPISLVGGNKYWLAIKGTLGSTNFGSQPCFSNSDIALSEFFGGVGLPNPKAGVASNISPYIEIHA